MAESDKTPSDHNEDIDKVLRGEAKADDPELDTRLPEDPSRKLEVADEDKGDKK